MVSNLNTNWILLFGFVLGVCGMDNMMLHDVKGIDVYPVLRRGEEDNRSYDVCKVIITKEDNSTFEIVSFSDDDRRISRSLQMD